MGVRSLGFGCVTTVEVLHPPFLCPIVTQCSSSVSHHKSRTRGATFLAEATETPQPPTRKDQSDCAANGENGKRGGNNGDDEAIIFGICVAACAKGNGL